VANKAILWRPKWCPRTSPVVWISLGLTWLAIGIGGPWRLSEEAERSPYHQVCPLDGKPATGTHTYVGKNRSREVYLCSFHMVSPPSEIPEDKANKPPYPEDVLWACGILFFGLLGAVRTGGYRRHPRALPGLALALSLYVLLRTTGGRTASLALIGGFLTSMLLMQMLPERPRWRTWEGE
jgi:hypothetical protein